MKVFFIVFVLIFSINSYAQQREVMNHFPLPGEIIGTNQKQIHQSQNSIYPSRVSNSKGGSGYIDTLFSVRYSTSIFDARNYDSTYYLTGMTYNYSQKPFDSLNLTLSFRMRVAKNGKILWKITDSLIWGDHIVGYNTGIIQTHDNNLLQMSTIYHEYNALKNYEIRLPVYTKFNQNGDTVWQKLYADTIGRKGGDWPMDIMVENDGGFTVAALTPSVTKSVYDSVSDWWYNDTTYVSLIRYDSLGNEIRRKSHFVGGEKVPIQIGLVLKLNDGGYIVGGTNNFNGITNPSAYYIFKTDSLFNWQWKKVFSRSYVSGTFMHIKSLSDTTYVFAMLKSDTPTYVSGGQLNYENYHHVGIMDKNFNIIKDTLFIMVMDQYTWGFTGSVGYEIGLDTINNHEFVVCANNNAGGNLIKMNTDLKVIWSRLISHYPDFNEETFKMRRAEDGGFLLAGRSNEYLGARGWFVKTDSLGFALPNQADTLYHLGLQEMQQNKTDLLVYPNPATNAFYATCNISKEYLDVYDILGNLKLRIQLYDGENKIDTYSLVSGVYVVKITSIDGIFRTAKLIIN